MARTGSLAGIVIALVATGTGACVDRPTNQQSGGEPPVASSQPPREDDPDDWLGVHDHAQLDGLSSLAIEPWPGHRFAFEIAIGGVTRKIARRERVTIDSGVGVRHVLEGASGEVIVHVDRTIPALVVRARTSSLGAGATIDLRASVARARSVTLDRGGPWAPDEWLPAIRSGYAVLGGEHPVVIASPQALAVEAGVGFAVTASAAPTMSASAPSAPAGAGEPSEARILFARAFDAIEANTLGAQLAQVPARKNADVVLDVRDAFGAKVPARIWIQGKPRIKPKPPHVWDPTRDAERTIPIVDVTAPHTSPHTSIEVPEGKWTLLATRGPGWSIARTELEVVAGEAIRAPIALTEETRTPDWIGCDFHVHARPSFDARAVSYEERVRSLVAVGVECAAATEHDHVGDHGPAAHALDLDDRYRALSGVELTTVGPAFGHFNVYPWPAGAKIPKTKATTPQALFDAVHKLPGSFIFQVNHPRMKIGNGSIGYLDKVAHDPKTGVAHGAFKYRRDYDAIEIYNGYDLQHPARVLKIADEWIRMLDRGEVHVATGSSDSHGISFPWAGFPRTMVKVGTAWRRDRPIEGIVDALRRGRAYVTSGPLLDFRVGAAEVGDRVSAKGAIARLLVAKSSWLATPTLTLRLGVDELPVPTPRSEEGHWVFEVPLPAVTAPGATGKTARRRPLVAIVASDLTGDAVGFTGFSRALAITNPIWIEP